MEDGLFCLNYSAGVKLDDNSNKIVLLSKLSFIKEHSEPNKQKYSKKINKDKYLILELSADRVVLNCYLKKVNVDEKIDCLLNFLRILKSLNEVCEVRMNSLYDLLYEALASSQIINNSSDPEILKYDERITLLSASNAVLSIELRKLTSLVESLLSDSNIYRSFCKEVLDKISKNSLDYKNNNVAALSILGINEELTTNIMKLVAEEKVIA